MTCDLIDCNRREGAPFSASRSPSGRARVCRFVSNALLPLFCATLTVQAVHADDVDDLVAALRLDDMVQIMRAEGIIYGEELALEMFANGTSQTWKDQVSHIYDADTMFNQVEAGLRIGLEGTPGLTDLVAFFQSDLGAKIVSLELDAREAMVEDDIEQAAIETYGALDGTDDPDLVAVTRFVEANDMIAFNVSATLNSFYHFYVGLVDGGASDMTERELLASIWDQEDMIRDDTRDWIYGYLLLAYDLLETSEINAYADLSMTPAGQKLNAALFAGYNTMYDDVSYALGIAAAGQMSAQDL